MGRSDADDKICNPYVVKITPDHDKHSVYSIVKTLFELDSSQANTFDVIRFVAATLVIFSHAYAVSGVPTMSRFQVRLVLSDMDHWRLKYFSW